MKRMLMSLALVLLAGVVWAESLEMLRQRAENGDRDAQCDLALRYYEGKGAPKDDSKAFYWAKKSADQGHADAQSWVGYFYEKGYGTEKDNNEAFYWYRRAADQGDRSAQNCLGELYYYGRGVERDFEKAAQWYKKSADQGFPSALFNIGWCYENGEGVAVNRSLALDYYRKAAAGGDTCARNRLAELGESADYSVSTSTTSTASSSHVNSSTLANAQAGDAVSQFVAGRQYFDDGNYEQAFYWWRTAARQGYGKASMQLGECYYNGSGVTRNYATAVRWYTEAAGQGEKEACFKLGACYEQGTGVSLDYQMAVKYYEKGDFMQAAALCYRKWLQQNRTGFNYLKASRSELLLHASQGDALAQCHLGLSDYADSDLSDAKSWFEKCESNTSAPALCRTIARKYIALIEAGEEETDALMEFFGF